MKLTKESFEKAKAAKSAEELKKLAGAENIELSDEEAARAFAELEKAGEISDEELDNVSGGCGNPNGNTSGDTPRYKVGDKVTYIRQTRGLGGMPVGKKVEAVILEVLEKQYGTFRYKVTGNLTKKENELYS